MQIVHALLIAALLALTACSKQASPPQAPAAPSEPPAGASAEPAAPAPSQPAPGQPAPGAMSVDEAGKMANDFIDKIVAATTDAGDDCVKLGANLRALIEDARQAAALEKEFEKNPDNKKAFQDKYQAEIDKKIREPMGKIEKCMTDPGVKAFIDAIVAE